jgi:hypothetical protein
MVSDVPCIIQPGWQTPGQPNTILAPVLEALLAPDDPDVNAALGENLPELFAVLGECVDVSAHGS